MSSALLDVRELSVSYRGDRGPIKVVRDVSFQLAPQEVLGIVGESGCGKTTTVRAVLHLLAADGAEIGGEVQFGGRNLIGLSERQIRRVRGREIAMIFQDPMSALNPVLRIGEQIEEALRARGDLDRRQRRSRGIELLEMVGVPAAERRFRQYPHEFSGGMRQRVLIAIALAGKPKVLLADEPTTALDVTTQAQILSLVRDLRTQLGMAVVLVTHNLALVAEMCDRVAVMYAGEVVETGATDALLKNPRHPYTVGLVGSLPAHQRGSRYLHAIPGGPPSLDQVDETCSFRARCPLATAECAQWRTELLVTGEHRQSRCIRHQEVGA